MKISCPKFQLNQLVVLVLVLFLLILNHLINPNLVKASVTSTTPQADFPEVTGAVYATAISEDGNTLYIGGDFSYVDDDEGGAERDNLAAIDLNTMLVTDWHPTDWNDLGPVYDIEIDGNDVLIGGGFYYHSAHDYGSQFVKINRNTGLIDAACPSVINYDDFLCTVYDIELTDDYIYLGGGFDYVGFDYEDGTSVSGLIRLERNTCQLDTHWLPEPDGIVRAIEAVGNDVLVGGSFDYFNGEKTGELVKVSGDDGSLISECNPVVQADDDTYTVYDIEVTDDDIYLGGSFNYVKGKSRHGLARLANDDNCTLDINWDPDPNFYYDEYIYSGTVYTINVDETDNSVYVGGSFDNIGGQSSSEFAKLDIDTGLADTDWNPLIWNYSPVPSTVYSSLITDNYLIVGGSFDLVGTEEVLGLAAFPYELPPTPSPKPTTTPKPALDSNDDLDSSSFSKESIQIPGAIKDLFTTTLVNKPIKDSNTNGQTVLSIIFPNTFNFNAYLSSNHTTANRLSQIREEIRQINTTAGSNLLIAGWLGKELMGFKDKGIIYWQVSNIQQINYKAYPVSGKTAPVIIPELQAKDSIIALKYIDSNLIPPGEPDTKFNENTLRLAHSLDGINWQVIPSSVVDTVNNTVAALTRVAGYYTIVGRY